MFAVIKNPPEPLMIDFCNAAENAAVSVGGKVVVFAENSGTVALCDVDKDKWSVEPSRATTGLCSLRSLKVPQIYAFLKL